jgi:hypothetical protein
VSPRHPLNRWLSAFRSTQRTLVNTAPLIILLFP